MENQSGILDKQKLDNRNHFVDVLKGICIVFVIITHYAWRDEERLRYFFPFWIDMAVPIFMIISGYVCSKSYKINNIDEIGKAYLLKNILKKIIRFTVPFFIAFIIEEMIYMKLGNYSSIGTIVLKFLRGGDGPGSYYFPIMIQFIFVFPIIYFIVKKYNFRGLVLCGCINFSFELLQRAYGMNEECYRLLLFRYILVIAFGCYLASETFKIKKALSVLSLIIGISFIVLVCYKGYSPLIIIYWTNTSFVACLYIIPITMLLINKFGKVRCRLFELLGKASFNIFLTQMVYYCFADHVYVHLSTKTTQVLTSIAVCIVCGIIFYYGENLLTKFINKKVDYILENEEFNQAINYN